MSEPKTPEAIAQWAAAQDAAKSPRKPVHRLTAEEIGIMLRLRQDGLTQVEIAQRLDCDQKAVSKWLAKLTDTTEVAKSYLRGSALRMAKNVVRTGQARDHIQALKGLRVLEEDGRDIKIAIGVSLPGMTKESYSATTVEVLSPQTPTTNT